MNKLILAGLLALLLWAAPNPSHASEADLYCQTGSGPNFQQVSPTNPCPVSSDSGTTPVQNQTPGGTRSAGQAVGGLWSFPVVHSPSGISGIATNFLWISTGGDTSGKVLRLWDKKPTSSTCSDGVNFVSNAADDSHLLAAPQSFTPAAPSNTTGDAKTYGNLTNLTFDFHNQDSPATQLVYGCVVTTGTDSADSGAIVYADLMGVQN